MQTIPQKYRIYVVLYLKYSFLRVLTFGPLASKLYFGQIRSEHAIRVALKQYSYFWEKLCYF